MMRRLISCVVRGGAMRRKSEQREGQNEAEHHRSFETSVHFDLLSIKGMTRSKTFLLRFAIFHDPLFDCGRLLMRSLRSSFIPKVLEKIAVLELGFCLPFVASS